MVPFEPSPVMAAQRPPDRPPAVLSAAEELPLVDDAVDAAMAIFTVHHWSDPAKGVAELRRVARDRVVIVTFDPANVLTWWLREYAPEVSEDDATRFPELQAITHWLGGATIQPLLVSRDCEDLFLGSLWGRPELLLDDDIRASTSGFARLDTEIERSVVARLRADLDSGEWDRRHGSLRRLDEYDVGVRLLTARG